MFVGACEDMKRIEGGSVESPIVATTAGSLRATQRLTKREIDSKVACKAFPKRICAIRGEKEGGRGLSVEALCQELHHVEDEDREKCLEIERSEGSSMKARQRVVFFFGLSAYGKEDSRR
jgi:hypothetical protein